METDNSYSTLDSNGLKKLSQVKRFCERDLFWFYIFLEIENIQCVRVKGNNVFKCDGKRIPLREIIDKYVEYRTKRKFSTRQHKFTIHPQTKSE